MNDKSGIYQIINLINRHVYVGSAVCFRKRWNKHINDLKKLNHDNNHLQKAFNKYKEESFSFEIIEECEKVQLIIREQFYIDSYKSEGKTLYNICMIAGNTLGTKRSAETKRKMSEFNPMKGKHHLEETK